MKRSSFVAVLGLAALGFAAGFGAGPADAAETRYKLPPKVVVDILDAAPTPQAVLSPAGDPLMLVSFEANPPIALLAQPSLRIGGIRITPAISGRQRTFRFTGIEIRPLDGAPVTVVLPKDAKIGMPVFAPNGRLIAFTRDLADGIELWIADVSNGVAKPIANLRVNDTLGAGFEWLGDSKRLLVRAVPAKRGAPPPEVRVPVGPVIDETAGKLAQVATFQDLLKTPHDEDLFEFYATSQLVTVDVTNNSQTAIGDPGLYAAVHSAPDDKHLLVTRLRRPFSYRVPFQAFTRAVEVWGADGKRVAAVADLKISDEVPRQGVPTGPRAVGWQPLQTATLVWTEALDGGDPLKKVPQRERLMTWAAPFAGAPRELLRLKHRYAGIEWTARRNQALLNERDRDRRWETTHFVDLGVPESDKVVFDRSVNDAYKDPGDPVRQTLPTGEQVALQDGDAIYLAGQGASESGDRPFVDKLDLKTLKSERLFQSSASSFERFLGFAKGTRARIVTRYESQTEAPNFFVVDVASGKRTALTDLKDPAPQLKGVTKELVKYPRKDGVMLSGTLYLPADVKPGTRLPAFIWAYPLEYSDADTAGQVRGSAQAFTRLSGPSPIFLVTQGYAVLMDATMPVVGDPETVNNSYVEQITESAKAAIDMLDQKGVVDRRRVVVGGHSYGAFMTANLLAHTDLFAAGIARSGAYNRTLTPFGFQTERRSYWEAPELYAKMSPFMFANKIKTPILLIHGEADNNSGTFPIQSERLFAAIQGNGGTARFVLLPYEAHGYRARESVLDTLAEMIEWADRYAKNHP